MHVEKMTVTEARNMVTRQSRELAELRSKLVDLDAWSLERIHDQERIIAELRIELSVAQALRSDVDYRVRAEARIADLEETNEKLRDLVKRTLRVD